MSISKDAKLFCKALLDNEEDFQKYVMEPGSIPRFSHSFLDSVNLNSLKASLLNNASGNPSYAEAALLDLVFKFDAIKRDLKIRKKRRADYYKDASDEYENEKIRLRSLTVSAVQTMAGNSAQQKGLGQ